MKRLHRCTWEKRQNFFSFALIVDKLFALTPQNAGHGHCPISFEWRNHLGLMWYPLKTFHCTVSACRHELSQADLWTGQSGHLAPTSTNISRLNVCINLYLHLVSVGSNGCFYKGSNRNTTCKCWKCLSCIILTICAYTWLTYQTLRSMTSLPEGSPHKL